MSLMSGMSKTDLGIFVRDMGGAFFQDVTDSGEAAIFSMSRRYPTQRHRGHREKTLIMTDAGRVRPAEITEPDTGSSVRSGNRA